MDFNAWPSVFYGNLAGNIESPGKVWSSFLGHLLGSFLGIKKCPLGAFYGTFLCPRELSMDQKSALESSLKSALNNSPLKKHSLANALNDWRPGDRQQKAEANDQGDLFSVCLAPALLHQHWWLYQQLRGNGMAWAVLTPSMNYKRQHSALTSPLPVRCQPRVQE